jgi:hypothetical protein
MKQITIPHRISRLAQYSHAIQFIAVRAWSDAFADSATWNLDPHNGELEQCGELDNPPRCLMAPPMFANLEISKHDAIHASKITDAERIIFNPGRARLRSPQRNDTLLALHGAGIVNSFGAVQNFVVPTGEA